MKKSKQTMRTGMVFSPTAETAKLECRVYRYAGACGCADNEILPLGSDGKPQQGALLIMKYSGAERLPETKRVRWSLEKLENQWGLLNSFKFELELDSERLITPEMAKILLSMTPCSGKAKKLQTQLKKSMTKGDSWKLTA